MRAVLEPEGYGLRHAASVATARHEAAVQTPAVVIIDEGLPDCSLPELCSDLLKHVLPRSVPILVYSAAIWDEAEEADALRAGAWDIIREPIRSRLLVEKLRRLIQIGRLIGAAENDARTDDDTGTMALGGFVNVLGVLGSLASRQKATIGCAVIGPTEPAVDRELLAEQRSWTAELVHRHTRGSDVAAWIGEADLAIVTYDTTIAGIKSLIRRLSSTEWAGRTATDPDGLSAGTIELDLQGLAVAGRSGMNGPAGRAPRESVAALVQIAEAQTALRSAREAGGGVRAATAP
jgi:CheY-like chemotaxis protein